MPVVQGTGKKRVSVCGLGEGDPASSLSVPRLNYYNLIYSLLVLICISLSLAYNGNQSAGKADPADARSGIL